MGDLFLGEHTHFIIIMIDFNTKYKEYVPFFYKYIPYILFSKVDYLKI